MLAAALSGLLLVGSCLGFGVTSPSAHPSGIQGRTSESGVESLRSPSVDVDSKGTQWTGMPTTMTANNETDALTFNSTNEYDPVTWSRWAHIGEPFKKTTLTAHSTLGEPEKDVFVWSFEDGTSLEGRVVEYTFKAVGKQQVQLTQTVASTREVYSLDEYVMVKYVRREIRQLTDSDREAFFDAMETLYRLPTAEGQAMYGDEYKGISFFVQMHLDGAGVTDCDHWHDDAGIMTHHVAYTLQFEQALQLVDPAVTIPYWEYTIEASAGLATFQHSEVFADDWFGSASPANALHTVDKGRWAYTPVMKEAWDHIHNAYGLLRTPWNLDDTPYVTRYNKTNDDSQTSMVSCSEYKLCFESTTFADLNNCLNGYTHGPVHIKLGGEWNDPEESFIDKVGYTAQVPLMTKYLWRKGYLRVPSKCTTEEDGSGNDSTCRASCPAEIYKSRGMTAYDVLMDVMAVHWIAASTAGAVVYLSDQDRFVLKGHEHDEEFMEAYWMKALESLCDPGHVGELFTSSAPYDPAFWVIHPTAERFLGWRRMLAREHSDSGWALDETWGYTHGETTGETGMICDWSNVREATLDLPTCSKGICGGHRALDILPFEVKVNGVIRTMSNIEWMDFIFVDNEDLPYMYNEFSWDHCAREGYRMGPPQED